MENSDSRRVLNQKRRNLQDDEFGDEFGDDFGEDEFAEPESEVDSEDK